VARQVSLFGDAGAMDGFGHEQDEAVSIADLVRSAAVPRGASRKAASVAAAAASARAELKPVWHDAEDDEVEVAVAKGYALSGCRRPVLERSCTWGACETALRGISTQLCLLRPDQTSSVSG
jgi:hypothetical protein